MNKTNILYLISRESVLEPGVLKSQVFDLLGQIAKDSRKSEVLVLDLPSFHIFLKRISTYRSFMNYAREIGVKVVIIPILPIGRSKMPVWAIPFFLIQVVPWILFFVLRYRINIIHARSYLSSLAVYFLRRVGLKVKFIFDMRAPWLIERDGRDSWKKSDFNYRFWEKLERRMFSSADRVVSQADGMVDYVKKISPSSKVVLIPNCVKDDLFAASPKERSQGRKLLGVADRFVLVYLGSLGALHNSKSIADFYSSLRKNLPNPFLLVVTHSNPETLIESLDVLNVPKDEFKIMVNPPNLGKVVPLGDAGINQVDGPSVSYVMAVKFPEYLAAGLPAVVTKNMTSITGIVEEKNCGVVVDPFDQGDIRVKMQKLVKERKVMGRNALKLARDYFSVRVCAKKYLEIYDELNKTG